MNDLNVEYRPIADLVPRATNPRTHSEKQIGQIVASIERFGFTNPALIDDADGIIAGHGRVEAAKRLGMEVVPAIRLRNMSEAEIRAYVIADNRLAENAGWDRELLAIEFEYLTSLDIDLDVTLTGFELPEIDILMSERDAPQADDADQVPEIDDGPAVTQPVDAWTRQRIEIGLLAPDIQKALLQGTLPSAIDAVVLMDMDLPLDWSQQRRVLGMAV